MAPGRVVQDVPCQLLDPAASWASRSADQLPRSRVSPCWRARTSRSMASAPAGVSWAISGDCCGEDVIVTNPAPASGARSALSRPGGDLQGRRERRQVKAGMAVEAEQHPRRAGIKVDRRGFGQFLIHADSVLLAGEHGQGPDDLVGGVPGLRHRGGDENLGRVGGAGRLAEGDLLEQPGQGEGERGDGHGDEEHGMQGRPRRRGCSRRAPRAAAWPGRRGWLRRMR